MIEYVELPAGEQAGLKRQITGSARSMDTLPLRF